MRRFSAASTTSKLGFEGREYCPPCIVAATDRMDRLIQDVLVYSRVSRSELKLERIELGSFLHGLIEAYPQFADANAAIEIVAPPGRCPGQPSRPHPVHLQSDGQRDQVRGRGSEAESPDLDRDPARPGGGRLYVKDNGIGIKGSEQDQIFEIFHRIGKTGAAAPGIGFGGGAQGGRADGAEVFRSNRNPAPEARSAWNLAAGNRLR